MDDFDRFLVRAWSRVITHGGAGTAEEIATHLALRGDKGVRKEDEDLPRGAIEEAIAAGEVTADELLAIFRAALTGGPARDE